MKLFRKREGSTWARSRRSPADLKEMRVEEFEEMGKVGGAAGRSHRVGVPDSSFTSFSRKNKGA